MGMGYRHAGSASYPRFEDELRLVAAALGCRETERLGELRKASEEKPFGYWFGCMYGDDAHRAKFDVPDGLPEAVARWLNDPYGRRTPEETREIWSAVSARPGIEKLSPQMWSELRYLAGRGEGWEIS